MCKKETAAAKNAGETKLNNDVEFGKGNKIPLWLFGFLY